MKLTKEQIQYIDDYLKHHQIKYWDIKIELLDHIVLKVEELMTKGVSFSQALEKVHVSFGNSLKRFWNSHIEYSIFANGTGYKNFVSVKRKQINKKYRKNFWCEIKYIVTNPKYLFFLLLFSFISYYFIFYVDKKAMKVFLASIVFLPLLTAYYYSIKMWLKTKKAKSINLEYALFYAGTSLIFFNLFFQTLSPKGMFHLLNENQFKWALVLAIPITLVFNYAGFLVYKKAYKYYNDLYNKLQLI